MRLHSSLLGLSLACVPVCGFAQVVNLGNDRAPMTEVHGLVRFHTGDDPDGKLGWASPNFDDSQWPLIHIDKPWTEQGFQSDSGFAWYRFQIVVPPGFAHLGLNAPGGVDSYEVFIAGQLVAKYGGMPPTPKFLLRYWNVPPVHPIPDELLPAGRPVEVALRVWHCPYWTFAAPGILALSIGDAQLLERQRGLILGSNRDGVSGWSFLAVACLLGLCAGVGLFLLRRGEFEYLWFAGGELGMAALAWWNSYPATHAAEFHIFSIWNSLANLVFNICWPTFLVTFLREPRRRLYWAAVGAGILPPLTFIPYLFQWISAGAFILLVYLVSIPWFFGMLLLVWIPARRGDLDARLLLAPQLLFICAQLAQGGVYFLQTTGHYSLASSLQDRLNSILAEPYNFTVVSLAYFLMQAAVLAILVLRFARKSRDEQRYKNELEAARTVQQVLVPAENPSVPGFAIESIYRPASEVGGDFFQIVATPDGGVLAVIGDVSGKGMPAAMTVSLLVGTFRTLAHYTQSPGEILHAMNQRMLARSAGGFTTCLVVRLKQDGSLTAANAGHIAPYLAGEELLFENGLPLGLAPDTLYPETRIQLPPAAQLTLLTDGVLEAQSPTGELFGFDRVAAISTQPAEIIAKAAQTFGQEDDITVLTLQFASLEVIRA